MTEANGANNFLDICVIGLPFSGRTEVVNLLKSHDFGVIDEEDTKDKKLSLSNKDSVFNNFPKNESELKLFEKLIKGRKTIVVFFYLCVDHVRLGARSNGRKKVTVAEYDKFESEFNLIKNQLIEKYVFNIENPISKPTDLLLNVSKSMDFYMEQRRDGVSID